MHRLAELSKRRRRVIGASLLLVGFIAFWIGVIWVHWASFPKYEIVDGVQVAVDGGPLGVVPRGCLIGEEDPLTGTPRQCLPWFTLGHLVAVGGSQMLLVGAAFLWVLGRKMTWAVAAFAGLIAWTELIVIFGIVPSEWLNLSQGPLNMSPARIALTVPPFLVLGNEASVSYAFIKDAISAGYNTVMLVVAAIFIYKLQDINRPPPAKSQEPKISPYGRPLVKGS